MNPDRQPQSLEIARVEWVPSSLDTIEVRVFGAWHGSTVPPAVTLVVGGTSVDAAAHAPEAGRPPGWSAAFVAPSDCRVALEAGEGVLDVGEGALVALPAAAPGRMDPSEEEGGVVVDPAVLAERRARRAELAEESAARRAASAEEAAATLRAQLAHLEERVARAGAERDTLAARVVDAERQLRLAEQREEAERRRRAELEGEVAEDLRAADAHLTELRARLAGAEEVAHALELELAHARRRQDEAERAAAAERQARRAAETELEELRRQLAEAPDPAETSELRARAEQLETVLAEHQILQAHAADLERRLEEADAEEVTRLRAHAAQLERRLAEGDPEEVAGLRAHAAELERRHAEEVAHLRARADELERRLVEGDPAELRELRARAEQQASEIETLRAKAAIVDVQATELDALRAQAAAGAEHAAELDRLRAHAAGLERRLAERDDAAAATEREVVLAERVASLEAELEQRIAAQTRVTEAIATVRDELAAVQAQVDAGRPGDATARQELAALEQRRDALEAAVRERDEELRAARAAAAIARTEADELREVAAEARQRAAEVAARLAEERALREAAEAHARGATRPELEAKLQQLALDLAAVRDRLAAKTAQLETRLADERARREAAEARLTRGPGWEEPPPQAELRTPEAPSMPAPAPDPFAAAEGDALDTLVAGLRAEVAAARDQLDALGEQPDEPAADPHLPAAPPPPMSDATRERLKSIEAELRAAIPEPGTGARDVVASLQNAAERLRAAAQEELARAQSEEAHAQGEIPQGLGPRQVPPPPPSESPAERHAPPPTLSFPGAPSAPSPVPGAPEAPASGPPGSPGAGAGASAPQAPGVAGSPAAGVAAVPPPGLTGSPGAGAFVSPAATAVAGSGSSAAAFALAPRALLPLSHETAWLRRGLSALAVADRRAAAELFAGLLPAQALVVDRLAYDVIVPELGPLRVRLADGGATVEPVEQRGAAHEVDAVLEGDLSALVPLAAGGAGWWLRGVRLREGRRKVWRLARARRSPVTLADLARSPQPPDPGLVLPILAAAVEPAWTAGHAFAVEYLVDGDGGWRVTAADGAPLAVTAPSGDATGTVRTARAALYPVLAGVTPPAGARVDVEGDAGAVHALHRWFDRARGLIHP